ncbi:restriction endonuclease subunit S [Leuconostoc citreum]
MSKQTPQIRFKGFTDDWEERKLEELGTLNRGKSKHRPRNDPRLFGGEYPFIQTGDVGKAPLFLKEYSQTYSELGIQQSKLWDVGTLLITIAANIADTAILDIKAAFPDSVIGFESTSCDVIFVKNYIDIQSDILKRKAETSSQANLNLAKLKEMSLNVPSLEEQQRIGSFFKQLDNTIALHQRKLDLLKEQKKGFLQKMFPKNGAKVPELRFAGFTDDWEERKLAEVSKIKTGSSDLQDATNNGEYPFFVRSEKIERSNRYLFDGEAILIPGEGRLGEIYHYINGKFDFHQRVYKISNFTDFKVSGIYIFYYMQRNFKRHAMKFTVKATVDSLRLPMLTEFDIKIPLEEEQQKIGSFFKQLDDTIALHQRKLNFLKEQKKGFLQKMFI